MVESEFNPLHEFKKIKTMIFNIANEDKKLDVHILLDFLEELDQKCGIYEIQIDNDLAYDARNK